MAEKVVIIGSGPAGWTAATYAARANLEPLVYEGALTPENQTRNTLPLGQLNLTTEVENFPTWPFADSEALGAFSKSALPADRYANVKHLYEGKRAHTGKRAATGPEMMEWVRQQAVNFGTRIVTDDIASVDFSAAPFKLHTLEGKTVEAHTVIIATGARANYIGLPSEDAYKNKGVSACAVCDGGLPQFKNVPVIVVGGGDSAVEEAMYLTRHASHVTMIVRRDQLRASQIMQKRAFENPKLSIRWNSKVVEVLGNGAVLTGVKLASTTDEAKIEEFACSGMFLGIGHTPNTDFLKGQITLKDSGYVVWTDLPRTCTSVAGVFAAGDVADDSYRQAVTAAGSGCMAALDAERYLTHHNLV